MLDRFIMDLVRAPREVERFLDALMVRRVGSLEKICRSVGDVVDIVRVVQPGALVQNRVRTGVAAHGGTRRDSLERLQ